MELGGQDGISPAQLSTPYLAMRRRKRVAQTLVENITLAKVAAAELDQCLDTKSETLAVRFDHEAISQHACKVWHALLCSLTCAQSSHWKLSSLANVYSCANYRNLSRSNDAHLRTRITWVKLPRQHKSFPCVFVQRCQGANVQDYQGANLPAKGCCSC